MPQQNFLKRSMLKKNYGRKQGNTGYPLGFDKAVLLANSPN